LIIIISSSPKTLNEILLPLMANAGLKKHFHYLLHSFM
jgi:hypothetical protein